MSATERREFAAKGFLALVVLLFSFNTLSHDLLCHEELEGVCHHLQWSAPGWEPDLAPAAPVAPSLFPRLSAPGEPDIIPGFISDIFHPPD